MLLRNKNLYVLADMTAVTAAFFLTALARYGSIPVAHWTFWNFDGYPLVMAAYILTILFYQPKKKIGERGRIMELHIVITANLLMAMTVSMALYLEVVLTAYPRSFYALFFLYNILLMYLERLIFRSALAGYYGREENRKKVLACVNSTNLRKVLRKLTDSRLYDKDVTAVAVLDGTADAGDPGQMVLYRVRSTEQGPELACMNLTLEEYTKKSVVDEALLSLPDYDKNRLDSLIQYFQTMGINVHVTVNTFGLGEREKLVETFGIYHVLTYAPRVFDPVELLAKRAMDILGAVVGLILTGILSIVVVPMIYLESPGPVIFTQTRIGLNGRRFKIYKFRSMYMDAEERKKELMARNEMNGLMFKVKDDPRITKIGKFIRKTSIDEFPQFFNVLKGEMSLVGTRPPTEDEFMQYEERHKRRLSLKPGITGLWQVSGRSDIQDFEDVVRLDCQYIDNWSMGLDVKILIQTVLVVLGHKGAR